MRVLYPQKVPHHQLFLNVQSHPLNDRWKKDHHQFAYKSCKNHKDYHRMLIMTQGHVKNLDKACMYKNHFYNQRLNLFSKTNNHFKPILLDRMNINKQ
jgi:hypothetical protein